MKFVDKLMKQAKNLLWDDGTYEGDVTVEAPTSTASITRDTFDEIAYDVIKRQTKPLQRQSDALVEDYDEAAGDLYEDVFNVLNQGAPMVADAATMAPTHRVNNEVMRQLANSDVVQELRKDTAHDRYQTLFSMLTMQEDIAEAYQRVYEAQQQQQQAQQDLQAAMGGPGGQPDPNALQQAISAAQQANQNAQQAAQQAAQQIQSGAQKAKDDIDETANALGGYGVEQGDVQHLSFEDRKALVQRLREDRMQQLSDLIGSFRSFALAERRKRVKHAPSEQFEYRLSNDLTKLVPEELNNLAVPELEELFWLRWAQHGLLTREIKGPAHAGQGPIIVVCDESGSMGGQLGPHGTREMWSKAVSLALCDAAVKGKRDFTYLGFGSYDEQCEFGFKKGRANLADVATFAGHFYGGGTSPQPSLDRALEIIREYEQRDYDKPDVVLISDGEFGVDEEWRTEWLETLKRLDAQAYGIQVSDSAGYGYGGVLAGITHHQLHITSLTANPEGVQELFAQI